MSAAAAAFSTLIDRVLLRAGAAATRAELEELFFLDEEAFDRDDPRSVGKRLLIHTVEFSGFKTGGLPFHYQKTLHSGLNLWVGDNLVGKSSIFKVIKFAIAGRNSLSKDVKSWLREVWVEFSIGARSFTSHIYKEEGDSNFTFSLYNASRETLADYDEEESNEVRKFHGGVGKYEEFMEALFFEEFNYYRMLRTQKVGGKDSHALGDAKVSWNTCFKAVYLEAQDYQSLMMGGQAELVLQMLLGLSFSYPINRLKVKQDHKLSELGLLGKPAPVTVDAENYSKTKAKLDDVARQIAQLEATARKANNPGNEEEKRLEKANNQYRNAVQLHGQLSIAVAQLQAKKDDLEKKGHQLRKAVRDYGNDIIKNRKLINDLQDYEQFGAFFNSLQVKTCPSCSHEVAKEQVVQESKDGTCRLCSHDVPLQTVEPGTYAVQIANLEDRVTKLVNQQYLLDIELKQVGVDYKEADREWQQKQQSLSTISLTSYVNEIDAAKRLVDTKPVTFDWMKHMQESNRLALLQSDLTKELAALDAPAAPAGTRQDELTRQIELLTFAQEELSQMREEKSQGLLDKLTELYLYYMHEFGLTDYQSVRIDEDFRFTYYKSDAEYSFNDISSGEQLRAKLGLYISIIQLDVQYQYGRHPRFIILDSPAKEEGDPDFVEALTTTLNYIEQNMQQDLQVFVGTAVRTLAPTVPDEKLDLRQKAGVDRKKDYFF